MKYFMNYELTCGDIVTPYAGVWIEILTDTTLKSDAIVTPYAGVWIEIVFTMIQALDTSVTPYAGVWIEITNHCSLSARSCVTPYAGVWIEIENDVNNKEFGKTSLPTRECGLKSKTFAKIFDELKSLPTRECGLKYKDTCLTAWSVCHSLRGSVD